MALSEDYPAVTVPDFADGGNRPPAVQLIGVGKSYGDVTAVAAVSLELEAGRFLTLLGPSGSGKTTTLHVIAGFTEPTAGEVLLDGQPATATPPEHRNLGVVFQNYALFPHMTV